MQAKILIVDDDQEILLALKSRVKWLGHEVLTAENGEQALALVSQESPDLLLLDIEMPGLFGLDVLKRLADAVGQQTQPGVIAAPRRLINGPGVIVLTAYGTVARAVEAMQLGAIDFLTKPFDPDHLSAVIHKALGALALQRQVSLLREEVEDRYEHIIGRSPLMVQCVETAKRAAASSATVLVLGETGTGKEVVARAIHRWSPRAGRPFVVVNCAALPESLLENELFGHEKGAFTGAVRREPGKIESADGGTVFLDEIGEMPLALQSRLLRVLQDQSFYRIGGTQPVRADVRFVAATNKDLQQAVKRFAFREDLYFRLDVVTLTLPPLRERLDDLQALVEHMIRASLKVGAPRKIGLSAEAWQAMRAYGWPGNVRELENVLMRALILCQGDTIGPEHLRLTAWDGTPSGPKPGQAGPATYHEGIEAYSRRLIEEALQRNGWNQTKTADELGLRRTSLTRLMRHKGISGKPPLA